MNRRRFLELLGMAAAGTGIVYSFPSVIVPKNIALPEFAPEVFPFEAFNQPTGLAFLLDDSSRVLQGVTTATEWNLCSDQLVHLYSIQQHRTRQCKGNTYPPVLEGLPDKPQSTLTID